MAAIVSEDKCCGCGACVDACPVSAIALDGDKAKVNADECISCGACVGECSMDAITLD